MSVIHISGIRSDKPHQLIKPEQAKVAQYVGGSLLFLVSFYLVAPSSWFGNKARVGQKSGHRGLYNPSNLCFMNSVLQSLSASDAFTSILVASSRRRTGLAHPVSNVDLSVSLLGLLGELTGDSQLASSKQTLNCYAVAHTLEKIHGGRLSPSQQDAQEFLQIVIERILHERVFSPYDSRATIEALVPGSNLLTGSTYSQLRCMRCGHEYPKKHQKFAILTLVVPQKWSSTLEECLSKSFESEYIQDYYCRSCGLVWACKNHPQRFPALLDAQPDRFKEIANDEQTIDLSEFPKQKVTVQKTTGISSLPLNLLVVHLNRSLFDTFGAARRNDCNVDIPEKLYVEGDSGTKKCYTLISLITHQGTHYHGHYISYKRVMSKSRAIWLKCNDDKVHRVSLGEVVAQRKSAYLLFYRICGK